MLRGLLERRVRPPSVDERLRRRSVPSETSQPLIIDTVRFAGHLYLWTKILRFVRISECGETRRKRESSRKRLTVMLYLFPAIAILLVFLQVIT